MGDTEIAVSLMKRALARVSTGPAINIAPPVSQMASDLVAGVPPLSKDDGAAGGRTAPQPCSTGPRGRIEASPTRTLTTRAPASTSSLYAPLRCPSPISPPWRQLLAGIWPRVPGT